MRLNISTEEMPERDRFDHWSATIFNTLAISVEPMPDLEGPYRGSFSARSNGPMLNCRFDSDGFRANRQRWEIAHRQWGGYRIYRESSAGVWFRIGGQEFVSSPGDLVVADADAPFEARPGDRYADESWLLPKRMVDPYLPSLQAPLSMRLSGRAGVDALAASYLQSVSQNWDSITDTAMGPITDTLARLVGIACGAAAEEHPDAVRNGRLAEARRHIDRNLSNPGLCPATVASALGISVRALHMLFEPSGNSFARYVLLRRLNECRAALLASPDRKVTDIAFAWGFNNLSTFYRAFQAVFEMTPGNLRATAGELRPL